ncbi:TadE/TadG family type IV pilus assembly protein [Rubinisphaera margarita]|uniref:TadE/TadG family type IV pilus assembly protein n=1 Tax=Rubinisphaera margarita TaxID=2909586 RepID=UPI001EE7D16B|nr:TadE family protein [Rubinisphaera margarita]MCG6156063.1 pilus assembly protein [Rubinisphaera margarita]
MQVISKRKSVRNPGENRRGAALVEFAIVAPLFLTLILGTVEIGNALEASSQINAALREAGRLAGMDWVDIVADGETPNEKVIRDIRNFLKAGGYPGDDMAITITSAEDNDYGSTFDLADPDNEMRLFQIAATIPFETISAFPHGFMNGHNISGRIVMRAGRISLMD